MRVRQTYPVLRDSKVMYHCNYRGDHPDSLVEFAAGINGEVTHIGGAVPFGFITEAKKFFRCVV